MKCNKCKSNVREIEINGKKKIVNDTIKKGYAIVNGEFVPASVVFPHECAGKGEK